jgi:hypothetical protein
MNLFVGKASLEQVFPYPLELGQERREMLQMVMTPTNKFLEEINDPFKFVVLQFLICILKGYPVLIF